MITDYQGSSTTINDSHRSFWIILDYRIIDCERLSHVAQVYYRLSQTITLRAQVVSVLSGYTACAACTSYSSCTCDTGCAGCTAYTGISASACISVSACWGVLNEKKRFDAETRGLKRKEEAWNGKKRFEPQRRGSQRKRRDLKRKEESRNRTYSRRQEVFYEHISPRDKKCNS